MYSTFLLTLIILITKLSVPYATEFNLVLTENQMITAYHIKKSGNDQWTLDWPVKDDHGKTRAVYYTIDRSNILKMEGFKDEVKLDRYFDATNVDWKNSNEIPPSESQRSITATSTIVKRDSKGFTLSQEDGLVSIYSDVRVNWVTFN